MEWAQSITIWKRGLGEMPCAGVDISQSLVGDEMDRSYDVLEVPLTTGETVTIYFDITDFYGKEIREMLEALGL